MKLNLPTFIVIVLVTLWSAAGIRAQEITVEAVFPGEPKAVKLPLPEYPELAKKDGIHGTIIVPVLIDEDGNAQVNFYLAAFGPYPTCPQVTEPRIMALRDAAKKSAQASKFTPVVVDGKSVKVRGKLIYTFSMPNKPPVDNDKPEQTTQESPTPTELKPEIQGLKGTTVNGSAISLPKPAYPVEARAAHATGSVSVRVIIDEKVDIYSAQALSGPEVLYVAAETAACQAKFSPTKLSGYPVKVLGTITYNFVP